MPVTVSDSISERVREIAEEVVRDPLYIVEVNVRGQRGSRVVEVFVDSDEVLSVEDLASASREIGFMLETADVIDGKYNLNVSSPGADRPLTTPRHFIKNVGREVTVRRSEPGSRLLTGTLAAADEEAFEIRFKNEETKRIAYDDAKEVRVALPW